jgi:Holliday junction resolvasome RuvABC endonuclease subunit
LVQPWIPSAWRKTVGLPGNAPKDEIHMWVTALWDNALDRYNWPQDACDAYCIALATRMSIQVTA